MTSKKVIARVWERDGGKCWHCGGTENLTIQHRVNRGMGGSKKLDRASNLILLCWFTNFEIEASHTAAVVAKNQGWKVSKYVDPATVPVFSYGRQVWLLLDDDFGCKLAE